MLELLDTIDSDGDFILESDTDTTSEDDDAPHATPQAAHPVSDSEDNDMDDEDYTGLLSPEQPLLLTSQFQELCGLKHMPPPIAFFFIWFVRVLALRPLLAYCASLG
jgi:hypothetical protein